MITIVGRQHPAVAIEKHLVFGRIDQPPLVDTLEQCLGTVAYHVPQGWIQTRKQRPRGHDVPAIPEIVGQLLQSDQPLRDFWIDLEIVCSAWLHDLPLLCLGREAATEEK